MNKFKRGIWLVGLFLPIVVLLSQISWLEYQISEPEIVRLRAVGYDPRSLISGHYLRLEIDWDKSDCRQFSKDECPKERFKRHYRYYVPEKSAQGLEQKIASGKYVVELEFSYSARGEPRLLNLLIAGKKWSDTQIND